MAPWNPRGDAHFRWRSTEVSRVEGFSDAVFGFALTLLVVSLEVAKSFDQLISALRETAVFAFCFALLYVVWEKHHRFFRRYGLQDGLTLVLNGLLLFVVMLYVYPLRFLATAFLDGVILHRETVSIQEGQLGALFLIYAAGFLAIFGLLGLLYAHALRHADHLELNAVERALTRLEIVRAALVAGVALLSSALVVVLPPRLIGFAGYAYTLIGAVEWWHGEATGRAVRKAGA